ncbi:hypothetical protein CXB51_011155 [Gossypium anomalum]|uniref:Chalcone synthase n=1 Tax=Gossypium anomalum TaxID=47600 RepID=A0A8J5Z8I7_9ROSI|nr:hypothetical protein CXB51_011155 [Gossypium anomalum]
MFSPYGIGDWNKLFYIVHPGGPSILRGIEEKLGLGNEKLKASWHVLSEYGNMWSPSVHLFLMRREKNIVKAGKAVATITTREGLAGGVLLAFRLGLTVWMGSLDTMKENRRGRAAVLAIGTANPPHCFYQVDYPDFYFRVTKSHHLTSLKDKFRREKSAIRKRYMHLTEDIINKNPNLIIYKAPSFDARQEILVTEVPKLGKDAALKAIKEWGQPISNITHLIFCTSSGIDMPAADHQLAKLIGLKSSVQRFMLYQQGCFAAGTALRLAKDLAENNPGARVLAVCSEIMVGSFQPPSETHLDVLVGSALFSDGAAAVIVGANPNATINERPLFQIVSAKQAVIPMT